MNKTNYINLCPRCGSEMKKQSHVYAYNRQHYRAWRCEKCQRDFAKVSAKQIKLLIEGLTEEEKWGKNMAT